MIDNSKPLLSICIPTFNRLECLDNCLNSIKIANNNYSLIFEVCISDNNPEGNAKIIVDQFSNYFPIKYLINKTNIGVGKNIFNVVDNAKGEFSWILGNDDMLLPHTFKALDKLFKINKYIDFFFINSFSISSDLIINSKTKFDFNTFPHKLLKFSNINYSKEVNYVELIDHKVSWDFMLGIFLSIFRTAKWIENKNQVNLEKVSDNKFYTNKYNTFPHLYIFSKAFMNSRAYIQHDPLSINLMGKREWAYLYPLVEAVRIPQVLDLYRDNGLPFFKYIVQKNFALRRFIPGFFRMIFIKDNKGLKYVNLKNDILANILYPSIYYYGIFYFVFKLFKLLNLLRK